MIFLQIYNINLDEEDKVNYEDEKQFEYEYTTESKNIAKISKTQ